MRTTSAVATVTAGAPVDGHAARPKSHVVATVAFADSRTAVKASEVLMKVHARNVGIEPVSGNRYDANDPDSQLWILLTGWHSVLYAYEKYGPGKLSAEDWRALDRALRAEALDLLRRLDEL